MRYQALRARDTRFDGRFFVGVTSTGIYCRPVCPARTPRESNCRFFDHAAQAEQAGFRPCLRCRPERAPGTNANRSPGDLNGGLARAAAQLIEQGALDGKGTVTTLAERIGISTRQLRRLFGEIYGVTLNDYAQTRRLLAAKRLLSDTRLPMAEVALAAGFASLRRFNAVFRQRYGLPPGRLRRKASQHPAHGDRQPLVLDASYRPPLAWTTLLGFFAQRALPGLENVFDGPDGGGYSRVIRHPDGMLGWLTITPNTSVAPRCHTLRVTLPGDQAPRSMTYLALARRLCDLDARPDLIDSHLGPLAIDMPGLRVPGGADGFEIGVRAIAGQVVSLANAHLILARLIATYGERLADPDAPAGLSHAFPTPQRLVALDVSTLKGIGLTRAKAQAIHCLATAVIAGDIQLTPQAPLMPTMATLRAIPGIGDWTAQYIAMRALDWPDAWPANDLILRRELAAWPHIDAQARHWAPWRAYAAMHLWQRAAKRPTATPQEVSP